MLLNEKIEILFPSKRFLAFDEVVEFVSMAKGIEVTDNVSISHAILHREVIVFCVGFGFLGRPTALGLNFLLGGLVNNSYSARRRRRP